MPVSKITKDIIRPIIRSIIKTSTSIGSTLPDPPDGYEYLVDDSGNYLIDDEGNYLITRINPFYQILIKTDNPGTSTSTQFTLPATGSYTIDWGDGTEQFLSGSQTHTYSSSGEYVIKVTGGLTRIHFNNGGDRRKLLEIQNWGDIAWTSMQEAYYGCSNLQATFTDAPNLNSCTRADVMFYGCSLFNGPVGNWDVSNITHMQYMFWGCLLFNQDISSWDVSNVIAMEYMFFNCNVFNQPLNSWDVSSVINFEDTFAYCYAFNQPLDQWQTISATNMGAMFGFASSFNQDISSWDVSNVTNFGYMLYGCNAFNQPVGDWDVSSGTVFVEFMGLKTNLNYSAANLDDIYNKWSLLTLSANEIITFGTIKYTAAGSAGRAILTSAPNNWTITDGGI